MGSLNQVIEDDNKSLERKERPVLHPGHRLRILFQIASAIDFLHTPLKDIRFSQTFKDHQWEDQKLRLNSYSAT